MNCGAQIKAGCAGGLVGGSRQVLAVGEAFELYLDGHGVSRSRSHGLSDQAAIRCMGLLDEALDNHFGEPLCDGCLRKPLPPLHAVLSDH